MKSIAKVLLVGAIAVMAISISAVPSEAKKKAKKVAACTPMMTCSTACSGGMCHVKACAPDGKWVDAVLTPVCWQPFCPSSC